MLCLRSRSTVTRWVAWYDAAQPRFQVNEFRFASGVGDIVVAVEFQARWVLRGGVRDSELALHELHSVRRPGEADQSVLLAVSPEDWKGCRVRGHHLREDNQQDR